MAGHSKWNNIRFRKEGQDKKKSKVYCRFARDIRNAAKKDNNPETNLTLKTIITMAKNNNVPKHIIDNALIPSNNDGEYVFYECMIGHGAFIIKVFTNNRNKTSGEIKSILNKINGQMSSCLYLFIYKTVIACDFILDDVLEFIDDYEDNILICEHINTNNIINKVQNIQNIEMRYLPLNTIDNQEIFDNFINMIEELDDVETIYTNIG